MKVQSPILCELQAADLVLQLAGRDRPAAPRCALADRRGLPQLPVERIEHALDIASIVSAIFPDHVRRCIALAMSVKHGAPEYDRKGIAAVLRASEKSVTRWLANGLAQVESALSPLKHSRERFTGPNLANEKSANTA